jgi:hypothetical protein
MRRRVIGNLWLCYEYVSDKKKSNGKRIKLFVDVNAYRYGVGFIKMALKRQSIIGM